RHGGRISRRQGGRASARQRDQAPRGLSRDRRSYARRRRDVQRGGPRGQARGREMGLHPQGRKPVQVSNVHIKNGRVIDPKNRVDAKQDVFIAEGKIAALGKAPAGFRAERTLAADALVVCPGLIDLSARLREPGFEYKATLASEMQAAVAGGVTSLACPPDTDPPLDEPGLVEML